MEFKPHEYQRHCIEKILNVKKIGLFIHRHGFKEKDGHHPHRHKGIKV